MENKGIKKKKKKWLIALAIIVLVPVILLGVLSLPFVQTFIAKQVAAHLTKEIGAQVSIEKVRITFSLNGLVKGLKVEDQKGNHLFSAKEILVNVKKLSLRRRHLELNKVFIKNIEINAKKYPGDSFYNFQFLLDYFASDDEDIVDKKNWTISSRAIEIIDSSFSYYDFNIEPQHLAFAPSHFSIEDFSLGVNNLFFRNDTLAFDLQNLSFFESELFQLKSFSSSIFISDYEISITDLILHTQGSEVRLNAFFEFEENGTEFDFLEDVTVNLSIENSILDLNELGYIVSPLNGIEGLLNVEGNFRGQLANIRGSDLKVSNGKGSRLQGNFHLTGLPNINETFFMVTAEELRTSIAEISSFKLPLSSPSRYLKIPSELVPPGVINFRGNLTGFLSDFVAYGNFNTSIGRISSDILVKQSDPKGLFSYSGRLITEGFDLGKVASFEKLGKISMDARIKGSGATLETANIEMSGLIKHLYFFDYHYENIAISGDFSNRKFNGALKINDPNIFMDFNGIVNFEEKTPAFNFNVILENTNLSKLNLFQRDELHESLLSGNFEINASASQLDDWIGKASVNNLKYQERLLDGSMASSFESSFLELENKALSGNQKQISLRSDFVDATMTGIFRFDRIEQAIESFASKYMPVIFSERSISFDNNSFANTTFEINLKNTKEITKFFLPFIEIGNGTTLSGRFGNEIGDLSLNMHIPEIFVAGNYFFNGNLVSSQENGAYRFSVDFEEAINSENLFMENFRFGGIVKNNSVATDLKWNNTSTSKDNYGNINNSITFLDNKEINIKILPSYVVFNNGNWYVNTDNLVKITARGIEVTCVELQGDNHSLVIDGIVGHGSEDRLVFSIDDLDVYTLWYLVDDDDFQFGGTISGILSLSGLLNSTGIQADLKIEDFEFNNVVVGDMDLKSNLDKDNKAFIVSIEINDYSGDIPFKPLTLIGKVYTGKRDQNFDLDLELENLDLAIWSKFLGGVANKLTGKTTGSLKLGGPFDHAQLTGRVTVTDGLIDIIPLNTAYKISNDVIFQKDRFVFNNLLLTDKFGNTGTLGGSINHVGFSGWELNLDINMNNLAVLDLPQEYTSIFYGSAFASGNAKIHGPVDDITIDINARTSRGTQLFFPIQQSEILTERSFISFINHDEDESEVATIVNDESYVTLNLDIMVTPDAEIQIIMDPRTGELIRGRGEGNLKINVGADGDFSIYGNLTIEEGDYLFKLQDLLTRRFRIESGGTLTWFGQPLDAEVNLKAIYQLKATLFELFADFADISDAYRRRVPVEVNLYLTDNLYPATLNFDINIPGAGEEINRKLEEIISTDQEMTNQVFSLLVFQRFIPAGSGLVDATLLGSSLGVGTTTELLTSQINNWLSQISRYFDIGVSYRPGDNITGQEVELALSTRLLEDRLTIDGSFGFAANNPYMQRTSNIIGDVNVEYKLNPEGNWRLKAFNRTNTFDIENLNSPYTQGIGIFFRRDFDRLDELFREKSIEGNKASLQMPDIEDSGNQEEKEE